MTDGWVKVWDQSFDPVPISRLHEMYAAGYRVMAGYAGGGSASKWATPAMIDEWRSLGPDTGIAALFEIKGTEPIDNPTSGDDHARAARGAWRALGYPDAGAISPAVDRNVTVASASGPLGTYFAHWDMADTQHPIAYVEMDAGAVLYAHGLTVGTFTPAAFSWDASDRLVTPANAPAHVLWTQEHNGQRLAGGVLDIGHIRTTAPIWWTTARSDGGDMAVTLGVDDIKAIATAVVAKLRADQSYIDATWRIQAMANGLDAYAAGSMKGQEVGLTKLIKSISGATPGAPADPEVTADAVADELAARLKVKPAS